MFSNGSTAANSSWWIWRYCIICGLLLCSLYQFILLKVNTADTLTEVTLKQAGLWVNTQFRISISLSLLPVMYSLIWLVFLETFWEKPFVSRKWSLNKRYCLPIRWFYARRNTVLKRKSFGHQLSFSCLKQCLTVQGSYLPFFTRERGLNYV